MSEREAAASGKSAGGQDEGPVAPDEIGEAALMREVLREQEQHREGGVDPELDEPGQDPGSEVQPGTP
jgi:hypothetical protein